jgi:uncharacterized protein (DUF1330 family)
MTVLNVAFAKIRDAKKMQEYAKAAAPIMKQFGAEVIVRGNYVKTLLGDQKQSHVTGIFRFPDMDIAEQFYGCPAYAALIPLREQAGAMELHFYEE